MSLRRKYDKSDAKSGMIKDGVIGLADGYTCAFSGQGSVVTKDYV
jgi:hypothetical protein